MKNFQNLVEMNPEDIGLVERDWKRIAAVAGSLGMYAHRLVWGIAFKTRPEFVEQHTKLCENSIAELLMLLVPARAGDGKVQEALGLAETIINRLPQNGEHWSLIQRFGAALSAVRALKGHAPTFPEAGALERARRVFRNPESATITDARELARMIINGA